MCGATVTPERGDGHACSATGFVEMAAGEVEQSLIARFAEQVAVHRDCIAVCDPELRLTYGDLDTWANAIAAAILERGGGGSPVAILLPQGARSVAAILGALKSGSPYVSLDPADPRSPELAGRVGASVGLAGGRDLLGLPTIVVDEPADAADPGVEASADDVAYVFFTSGSTGRPKGVVDSHRNVLHNVLRYTNTLHIAPSDRLSLIQSPSFSGTASSLFSALLSGAAVCPFPLQEQGLAALGRWLVEERVTIYHSVPGIFRSLVGVELGPYEDVRIVRLEGDRAAWKDVALCRRHFPSAVLVNGLGITETGLVRQLFVDRSTASGAGVLPVGYPVPGVAVLIIDERDREVPAGAVGEIAVQSDHLALGYWGEEELTDARFRSIGARRTYLTGDLGRALEDGCVEHLGRRDGTLKILGNRVEPAEIEAELLRLPGIEDAAVVTVEGRREEGQLAAYAVSRAGGPSPGEIRDALGGRLPRYMVPSRILIVDELPRGRAGKLDRRELALERPYSVTTGVTELERIIGHIWEDVLEVGPIAPDDDFFHLGGDSLASAEIVARVERETGITLPLSTLAAAPTVRTLAGAAEKASPNLPPSLVVLREDGRRTPLVLLHGNRGNALHYGELVRASDFGRPIWALEHRDPVEGSIAEMATRHLTTLVEANPTGPHLLAGFCYGAVVAQELARQLAANGSRVGALALLGITPLEFPTVVAAPSAPPLPVARRVRRLAGRARRHFDRSARHARRFDRALARHRPEQFPGRALVVVHEDEATAQPEHDWAPLAREIEVVTLPGRDHAMLEQPGVARLAALIRAAADVIDED